MFFFKKKQNMFLENYSEIFFHWKFWIEKLIEKKDFNIEYDIW